MKGIKTLILILCISWGAYAQQMNEYTYSIQLGTNQSKGVEIRGEFQDWYSSFYWESIIIDKSSAINWGFEIGLYNEINNFTVFYGINLGILRKESNKPVYGANIELDYNITRSAYIGLKVNYSRYQDSPRYQDIQTKELLRPLFKIGYKF